MKLSTLIAVLSSSSVALALVPRQDTASTSSTSSTSTVSSSSTSTSTSASSSITNAPSSTSASSTNTASSSSTVSNNPTASNLPEGVTVCSQRAAENIFTNENYTGTPGLCGFTGNNNTIVVPAGGFQTWITWSAVAFPADDSTVTIHLDWTDNSGKTQWTNTTASWYGFTPITVDSSFLNGAASSNFRLILDERHPGGGATTTGPIVTFVQENTTPQPPAHTSFNALGLMIGLPIGLAVVAGVLILLCCAVRKERGIFAKIKLPTSRKGYGVGRSRRQRMGGAVDDYDFDASAPIYRDDPAAYQDSTREERSARAMGVFSAERNLHSTH